MKILLDVNVPQYLINHLLELKYQLLDVKKSNKRGVSDQFLRKWAEREGYILLTYDKDFLVPGELPLKTSIIVLHFSTSKPPEVIPYLDQLLNYISRRKFSLPFIITLSTSGIELVS